jgi:hypothetical protein
MTQSFGLGMRARSALARRRWEFERDRPARIALSGSDEPPCPLYLDHLETKGYTVVPENIYLDFK